MCFLRKIKDSHCCFWPPCPAEGSQREADRPETGSPTFLLILLTSTSLSVGRSWLAGCGLAELSPTKLPRGLHATCKTHVALDSSFSYWSIANLFKRSFWGNVDFPKIQSILPPGVLKTQGHLEICEVNRADKFVRPMCSKKNPVLSRNFWLWIFKETSTNA